MRGLLKPKSVAVIGASHEAGKIGFTVFDNLKSCYSGQVYPINPNTDQILGEKTYPTVLSVPGDIELAIICVPAQIVPRVLESCGKKKIPYVIIISSGFSEAGGQGKELEKETLDIAKKHHIRLLGPNCLGVINNFAGLNASFATAALPAKYRVGIFSQSGAMGAAILDFANGSSFGFSYFVSLGNKSDISEVDLIDSWANDDNVAVGVGYLEDIKDGPGFIAAAKKFTSKKPLIILKGGTTKEGEKAARLHTAALAQDEVVFRAAMDECGVILAENLGDLLELAVSFATNGLPKSRNLAIISNAGGPSVLAADACGKESILLPTLAPHTLNELVKKTEAASITNPIDLRGDAKAEDFKTALTLCQKDKNVDGILLIATPQAMTEVEAIAWEAVRFKKECRKPIYVNFIGGALIEEAKIICLDNGIAVFSYPERAVRAFRFQSDFEKQKKTTVKKLKKHPKHHVAKSIINFSEKNMSYGRISSLLSLYGIEMAETYLAKNEKEAIGAFKKLKPPVVLKISSPDILHKTDVGGVILGIETADEVRAAYEKILSNVKHHNPRARIEGVTVMESAKEGIELILGAKRDTVFGPVVMFGFGGIFVELVADFSVGIGDFDRQKAIKLIEGTSAAKILEGYRAGLGYSKEKLIDAIIGISQLIGEHEEISSIEINPLVLEDGGRGLIGLDAKIELCEH
jgi:acetyl coenzyme A synthetase (ADP forming)-like protein